MNRYDAEGLRYEIQENDSLVQFIYSDKNIVTETNQDVVIRYIRGHQLIASDSERARTYYHYVSDATPKSWLISITFSEILDAPVF